MTIEQFKHIQSLAEFHRIGKTYLDLAKEAQDAAFVREALQHMACVTARERKNLLLEWCTGFGKTKPAVEFARSVGGNWLIVYAKSPHRRNLEAEVAKWAPGLDVEYVTYLSLSKHVDRSYTGIIFDEVHYLNPNNIGFAAAIQTEYRFMLSATVPIERRLLIHQTFRPIVNTVTIRNGINWGVLPFPKVYAIPLELKDMPGTFVFGNTSGNQVPYQLLLHEPDRADSTWCVASAPEFMILLETALEYWKERIKSWAALKREVKWIPQTRLNPLGNLRKQFLSNVKYQLLINTPEFLAHIGKHRSLIFMDTIAQTESLPFPCVHSGMTAEEIRNVIEDFNESRINQIVSVNMLNESMNLINVELGVVNMLAKSNNVSVVQRIGRILRGSNPQIILPYVLGTSDEKSLRKHITSSFTIQTGKYDENQSRNPGKVQEP